MNSNNLKNWFIRFIKGLFIALGFILPGISGGVLAAILGIYERLLAFMAHIRQNFSANVRFFLPVGLGGLTGIILLSNPLAYLLSTYQAIVLWGFAGAIIGTIPSLFKASTTHSRTKGDWLLLISTTVFGSFFLYNMTSIFGTIPINFFAWILAGSLLALGIIVPGLSPSNLLLYLGLFNPMLLGFKNGDLGVFIPMALGAVLTLALLSKLMHFLLQNYHNKVYHFILGIVISSTFLILIPPVADYQNFTGISWGISLLLLGLGISLGYWMSTLEEKYK
ncbi:DUF368 domain-containing protein [Periweissella beninensis]|uniref:DUF368 domain-containing protein n=1 Tax=Periweissella beninensis TaxID=504936 RepID=UPI0021A75EA5|nr:DUF368 domain-containing protein [Periweissella beninensis]MCT4396905.1 DUF368 domain-containing protein [Periweissella beninensis]